MLAETIGPTALPAMTQFARRWPSLPVILACGVSFSLPALTLRSMPVGGVHAIWSGLTIFCVALIGFVVARQIPDLPAVIGLTLITSDIPVIHMPLDTASH